MLAWCYKLESLKISESLGRPIPSGQCTSAVHSPHKLKELRVSAVSIDSCKELEDKLLFLKSLSTLGLGTV